MSLLFARIFYFTTLSSTYDVTYTPNSRRFSSFIQFTTHFIRSGLQAPFLGDFLGGVLLFYLVCNIPGNIPLYPSGRLFYTIRFSISFIFWTSLIVCVAFSQAKLFLAHLLPVGAPVSVMFLLPLVELFSNLIRPLTLVIRVSTNLAAGHIIKLILSYFALLSPFVAPAIFSVLYLIFLLEVAVSLLQAYIFVALLQQYFAET
jgi:ATP synthase subunit 6